MSNGNLNLKLGDILIKQIVYQREEKYYLITKSEINNINSNKFFSNIFIIFASLLIGAFFSVIIGKATSINITTEVEKTLSVYRWISFSGGLLFCILAGIYLCKTNKSVNEITSSSQIKFDIQDKT